MFAPTVHWKTGIPYYRDTAVKWCDLLFSQALNLRDIGTRVRVVGGDGRDLRVDRVWLERETNVMSLPMQTASNGEEYFQLQGELDDELLSPDEKNRVNPLLSVRLPHTNIHYELEMNAGLVREWIRHLKNMRDPDTEYAWECCPEAMKAAEQLVSLTGLVPGGDLCYFQMV